MINTMEDWYLDGYLYGAMLGDQFPVNSYGPASKDEVELLQRHMSSQFDRTEIVPQTKGQSPLDKERWLPWLSEQKGDR